MEDRTVAFFTCVNDENLYAQCVEHLRRLRLPRGFSVRAVAMRNAHSLTTAYNEALRRDNARYKVFLHQDAFIVDLDFVARALAVFQEHPEVGLIGVTGSLTLPPSGIWWEAPQRVGRVLEIRPPVFNLLDFGDASFPYTEVAAVDGLLMMTQYDCPWDERIAGFHFYDTSQCLRHQAQGHKVAVMPAPHGPPVVHACGHGFDAEAYERLRRLFLDLYPIPEAGDVAHVGFRCSRPASLHAGTPHVVDGP